MNSVRVSSRGANRIRAGHPWVYRTDVQSGTTNADVVAVLDEKDRFLGSALWAESGPLALRVYERGTQFVSIDDLLAPRLDAALRMRLELYGAVDVCRLVHAEADQLPGLFVDRYGDALVVQSGTAAMDGREDAVARILAEKVGARLVVARDDGSMRQLENLPRRKNTLFGGGSTTVQVPEGAATLELDLLEDAKTGSFLDQRENHARAGELARGKVLDAFTYHGGFALAMAARASHVLGLDEDAQAVERARKNAVLSHLPNAEFQRVDAFVALREYERTGRKFDTIVLDPPALAKRHDLATALRAYRELNLRALRILEPGGWLVTCSCSGKVTAAMFEEMLLLAARDSGRQAVICERRGAGRDHPVLVGVPETEYLKCWFLRLLP